MKNLAKPLWSIIGFLSLFSFALGAVPGSAVVPYRQLDKAEFNTNAFPFVTIRLKSSQFSITDTGGIEITNISGIYGGSTNISTNSIWGIDGFGNITPIVTNNAVIATNIVRYGVGRMFGTESWLSKALTLTNGPNYLGAAENSQFFLIGPTTNPADCQIILSNAVATGQKLVLVNQTNAIPSEGAWTMTNNTPIPDGAGVVKLLGGYDLISTNGYISYFEFISPDWQEVGRILASGASGLLTNVFNNIVVYSNITLRGNSTLTVNNITVNGTNLPTINPTDLYVPYRTGTNSFGDSLFYRPNNYTMMLEGLDSSISKQVYLMLTNTSDAGSSTFISQDVNAGAFGTTKPEITLSIPNYVLYLVPGQFRPDSSNHIDLGVPIVPWAQVYAQGYNWFGTNDNTGNYSGATASFDMVNGLVHRSIAAGTGGPALGFLFTNGVLHADSAKGIELGGVTRTTWPSSTSDNWTASGTTNSTLSGDATVNALTAATNFVANSMIGSAQVTNNIGAILSVGDATYVDLTKASQTNAVSGAVTISFATNGIAGQDLTHVRWFFNGSGSDQTITIPSGWRTNLVSAVPAKLTNAVITVMYVKGGGPTASAATQTNCYVSFEYYK